MAGGHRGGRPVPPLGTVGPVTRRIPVASVIVLAALVAGAVVVVGSSGHAALADLAGVQEAVRATGVWAPAVFVLLQATITVAPIPRTLFSLAAGALFGSVTGLLLAVAGTTLAAAAAFWLARTAGGPLIRRYAGSPGARWLRARLDRSGLLAVVSMRLMPVVPFFAMNYAAGPSGVRFPPFLLGTAIGILPGTAAVVVLGDAVTGDPPPALIAISVVCAILGSAGLLVASRRPQPAGGRGAGPAGGGTGAHGGTQAIAD